MDIPKQELTFRELDKKNSDIQSRRQSGVNQRYRRAVCRRNFRWSSSIGWLDQNEETLSMKCDVDSYYELGMLWTHVYRRDRPEAPFSLHEIKIGVTDVEQ